MEGGFAVANIDDARARRARRMEILRLNRNGGRALYPPVVSRSGCEYNFCNLAELLLYDVLFEFVIFCVCIDVVGWFRNFNSMQAFKIGS